VAPYYVDTVYRPYYWRLQLTGYIADRNLKSEAMLDEHFGEVVVPTVWIYEWIRDITPKRYSPSGEHPLEKIWKLAITRTPDPNRPTRRRDSKRPTRVSMKTGTNQYSWPYPTRGVISGGYLQGVTSGHHYEYCVRMACIPSSSSSNHLINWELADIYGWCPRPPPSRPSVEPPCIGVTSWGHCCTCPSPWACVCTPIWQFLFTHISNGSLAVNVTRFHFPATDSQSLNPLECKGNYSAILWMNNVKLAHWPLMGVLLYLVQPQPAQAPPRCTKCNSTPINGQCINHPYWCITVRCCAVSMCPLKG